MEMQISSVLFAFLKMTQIKTYLLFQFCCFLRLQSESLLFKKTHYSQCSIEMDIFTTIKCKNPLSCRKIQKKKCLYKANMKRNTHTFREM